MSKSTNYRSWSTNYRFQSRVYIGDQGHNHISNIRIYAILKIFNQGTLLVSPKKLSQVSLQI